MKKEDYQSWRHEPVTKLVLKFLADKQAFLKQAALEQWISGSSTFADCNQTVRGQIIELQDMIDLPFEAIEEFYQSQEEDNGTEPKDPVRSQG